MSLAARGREVRRQQYETLLGKAKEGKALTPAEIKTMAAIEKEFAADDVDETYLSMDEVLDYTGYKPRSIYAAVSNGELYRQDNKTFALSDIDAWLVSKGRAPVAAKALAGDDDGSAAYDKTTEEARYRYFRAQREELVVKHLQRKLVSREEVERQFAARAGELKQGLLLLSRRISHKIAISAGMEIPEVAGIIDSECLQLLTAMSRQVDINEG